MSVLTLDHSADPFLEKIGVGLDNLGEGDSTRLPTLYECAAHLKLLNAIVRLQVDVEEWADITGKEKEEAWSMYCSAAVERFLKWSQAAGVADEDETVPPLDILMVWHSYMLNTAAYQRYMKVSPKGRLGRGIDWGAVYQRIGEDDRFNMSIKDKSSMDKLGLQPDLLSLLTNGGLRSGDAGPTSPCEPLKFDMVAAVLRQLRFAHKMHRNEWLHSRFSNKILESAIKRYAMFFTLIGENPGNRMAPTPDIDLVWHTHQLSPNRYGVYSAAKANGRFIHHNDSVAKERIHDSFIAAKTLFQKRFGRKYSICYCDHCMVSCTLRSSNSPVAHTLHDSLECAVTTCYGGQCRACEDCGDCEECDLS
ncbi:hypothetical protein F5Y10DRAFT_266556 [Nemania abortiva]|nr:hypothetical protein F5Y10DRAFT_266556 [Nemania abortiva]